MGNNEEPTQGEFQVKKPKYKTEKIRFRQKRSLRARLGQAVVATKQRMEESLRESQKRREEEKRVFKEVYRKEQLAAIRVKARAEARARVLGSQATVPRRRKRGKSGRVTVAVGAPKGTRKKRKKETVELDWSLPAF